MSARLSPADLFRPTVLLALALMAIIVMMILPMPSWVLDFGLAASFALAILIFTITLFVERPLDFSAFPTVLLASLALHAGRRYLAEAAKQAMEGAVEGESARAS